MDGGPHFRNASWGMAWSQVRQLKLSPWLLGPPPDASTREDLMYQGVLVGCACIILYGFTDGTLTSGNYLIEHGDEIDVFRAYEDLKLLLESKYGAAAQSDLERARLSPRVKVDTVERLVRAVSAGKVTMRSIWHTTSTRIYLSCSREASHNNVWLRLQYYPIDYHLQKASVRFRTDRDLV